MSAFERETDEVLTIVHENPRRQGIVRTIGYIVTEDEARQLITPKTYTPLPGITMALILFGCLALAATLVAILG